MSLEDQKIRRTRKQGDSKMSNETVKLYKTQSICGFDYVKKWRDSFLIVS